MPLEEIAANVWRVALRLPAAGHIQYKYGLCEVASGRMLSIEQGPNRLLASHARGPRHWTLVSDEGYARPPKDMFRGCGVAVPVFSLRSALGLGVGEFADLTSLADWAAAVGLRADTLREVRAVIGGVLVQDRDQKPVNPREFKVVTKRQPTADEMTALLFGWRVVRHVKSNAIVYAGKERTLSVGAGQMSRIDSSRIAVWKAGEAKLSLTGSAIASDAFFPFPDGLLAAADAGATCAIQPGGSVKDPEVIAAADARGMAMVFTGMRHFRH